MKEKVASKLSNVFKSLEAAKKYNVDVRMEDKKFMECNIAFHKNSYSSDERFNLITSDLRKTEQEKYDSILKDLVILENTILDKRRIYQVRETLSGMFRDLKSNTLEDANEFINKVKMQLRIFNSCKISEIYRPEGVIDEIFGYIYEAIKVETWFNNGKSILLDEVLKDESNMTRINSFLSKDIFALEKMLGSDNEQLENIKKYRIKNKENGKSLIDIKLINMVANTIVSYEVEDVINLQTKNIEDKLNKDIEDASKKRKEYKTLAELQINTRKFIRSLRQKIDKRLAPILLSLVIMSGVGVGTYYGVSNATKNETTTSISEVNEESIVKPLGSSIRIKDSQEKNSSSLLIAGVAGLASAFIPKVGFVCQCVGLYKDKKKYNNGINKIVERKHQMEDLKKGIEKIANTNSQYLKELYKQREKMIWASLYLGLSEEQSDLLTKIGDSINTPSDILYSLEKIDDEPREDNEKFSKRLGR